MANPEHLAILQQGVAAWNEWRKGKPGIEPDLDRAELCEAKLSEANLHQAKLISADLRGADLSKANLRGVMLYGADLRGADLRKSDLTGASLNGADLTGADLTFANLHNAKLFFANLAETKMGYTILTGVVLNEVRGLETVQHIISSSIGIDTIYRSKGQISEAFLRGAGVPENFITFMHSLTSKAFEYYSCFISYSDKDKDLAERLYGDLQAKGVRCWFAPEDLKIGDKFEFEIDQAIRLYDKLLLVLSETSIESAWVEHEVRGALKKEQEQNRTVLFPIRLDNAVMETTQQWAHDIKRNRHVGDFSQWKDHDYYQKSFARLLRDLQASNAKPSP